MPGEHDDARTEIWRREMDGARACSGRLFSLMGLLLGTLLCLNTAFVILPITVGRFALTAFGVSSKHDLYAGALGIYTIWGASLAAYQIKKLAGLSGRLAVQYTKLKSCTESGSAKLAVRVLLRSARVLLRMSATLFFGLGVLPLLMGLYIELAMMPLRLLEGQTPVFFVYHDWTIGLLVVKLSYQVLIGAFDNPEGPHLELEEGIACLRPVKRLAQSVQRMKAVGFTRMPFPEVFRTVFLPTILFWGVAVSTPYIVSRALLPRIPFVSVTFLHIGFTYGWLIEAQLVLGYIASIKLGILLKQYRAKIRDQQYLLHRELINMPLESR